MEMTQRCQFNGKNYTMTLNCTMAQLLEGANLYNKGALLQNAFSFLNADEREFVKTGTTPEVWNEMFGNNEELENFEINRSAADPDERAASDANDRHYGATD